MVVLAGLDCYLKIFLLLHIYVLVLCDYFLSGCQSGLVCVWRIPQDTVQTSIASSEGWWDQESNCQVNLLVFLKALSETINAICF